MNDCGTFEPLLAAQADGALAGAEREALAAHLEACPGCRWRLAEQRAVDALLRAQDPPAISEREWAAQWERIARSLPASGTGSRRRPGTYRLFWLPTAAAAVLALAAVWWFSEDRAWPAAGSPIVLAKADEARIEELTINDEAATGMIVLTSSEYAPVIWIADRPDKEVPS